MVSRSKRRRAAQNRSAQSVAMAPASRPSLPQAPSLRPRRRVRARARVQGNYGSTGAVRSSGVDLIYNAQVTETQGAGFVVWTTPLGPEHSKGTRFHSESKLWARWRPASLSCRFIGTGGSSIGGAVAVGWTPDTSFTLSKSSFTNVNVVLALERSAVVRLDGTSTFTIPSDPTYRWYSTNGENEAHGKLFLVVVSPPNVAKGTFSLLVELSWNVYFEGRRIVDLTLGPHGIAPEAGFDNLFTTSDSSFDSSVLTFKAHSGGSMVPWSGVQPNTIYRVMVGDVSIPYIAKNAKGENVTLEANYFTKVQDYTVKGLVLHEDENSAKQYIKTGDKRYCVKYVAAGGYTTPSRPTLVADPDSLGKLSSFDIADDFERLELGRPP